MSPRACMWRRPRWWSCWPRRLSCWPAGRAQTINRSERRQPEHQREDRMKHLKTMAGAGLAAMALTGPIQAQVVSMATGAQGSLAYNSGQAVAVVANDNAITVRTQPLVGYMPLLNAGEVDFGYANGAEAAFAYTGTGNFDREHPDVRLVGTMFNLTTGVMAPCDLNLRSVDDLEGRSDLRIASEYTSSTIIPYYIAGTLATTGLSYDDFQQVPVASFVAGIEALGDGLVDVALVSLNAGAGQQAAVQLQDRGGLCYISLDNSEAGVAAFTDYMPAAVIAALPQNENLNGLQNYDANLMRIPWMMLVHEGADEDLVYTMTRAIAENQETLAESFGAFRNANLQTMAPRNQMPYHPGAARYYEEAGIPVNQ